MPESFIHWEAFRQGINSLEEAFNSLEKSYSKFSKTGSSADELKKIVIENPQYAALGAVAPDIFALLPDFKPNSGKLIRDFVDTATSLYEKLDSTFLEPYEKWLEPNGKYLDEELNALFPGFDELNQIAKEYNDFLKYMAAVMLTQIENIFGDCVNSGVTSGYDELTFFWSDMIHYRKTFEFPRRLWENANGENGFAANDCFKAFALGWMSHVATDVTGHCYVNQKCGGPFRTHMQRHHLIENHMDSYVYRDFCKKYPYPNGTDLYQELSCSAQHLWISFDEKHQASLFDLGSRPQYNPADNMDAKAFLDRKEKWDADSEMPDDLTEFIYASIAGDNETGKKGFFDDSLVGTQGQWAGHPTILVDQNTDLGYPSKEWISKIYGFFFKYIKMTTTDYYTSIKLPDSPKVVIIPDFPQPPGTSDDGILGEDEGKDDENDRSIWKDVLNLLLAIFAYIEYVGEVLLWLPSVISGIILGLGTYLPRLLIYELVEIPLYNAWLALHWYMCMTGYLTPTNIEISDGLVKLGVSTEDVWSDIWAALDDPMGGLNEHRPPTGTDPTGYTGDDNYPKDMVLDPSGTIKNLLFMASDVLNLPISPCSKYEQPSEFLRPWRWPGNDNDGHTVPVEHGGVIASPYIALQDATILVDPGFKGDSDVRYMFECAENEFETIDLNHFLPEINTLGAPPDYTAYVIHWLTRDDPGKIPNFNLDSDRGYGYKCWDWVRSDSVDAAPMIGSMKYSHLMENKYKAPLNPGSGWCDEDLLEPLPSTENRPKMHDKNDTVRIRYIDCQDK